MDLLYEVWLHTAAEFEPEVAAKAAPLIERKANSFTSGEMDKKFLRDIGVAGEFQKRFSDPEVFSEAKGIIKYCKDNEIRIVTMDMDEYPESLRHINLPPRLLFVKGAPLNEGNGVSVSVVGCRKPTDHGKSFARLIGKSLGQGGITVVSGMAEGIDGQAHLGALDAGGRTIAVLAGSVDEVYPKCHQKLYSDILKNGGSIVSERPPKTPVKRYFYQQRNRIIVGMTSGTVIVEGKLDGGTAITARLALEENKDIFAVPQSPMLWQSELPNRLIEEGAIIVTDKDVPLNTYKARYPKINFKSEEKPLTAVSAPKIVSEDARIIELLKENGGILTADFMAENLKISTNVLSGRLTILCIKGRLRQESGNRYILVE